MAKFDLVVTIPFGDYSVGQRITDDAEIAAALEKNARHVVRVAHIDVGDQGSVKSVDPVAGGTPAQAPAANQSNASSAASK